MAEKEYIERGVLIGHLHDEVKDCGDACENFNPIAYGTILGLSGAISFVNTLPAADVVEVVRCKDCKYFIQDAELDHNEYPNIIEADGLCDCSLKLTDADDFCSNGERKD